MEPTIHYVDSVLVAAHWHNAMIVDQGGKITLAQVPPLRVCRSVLAARNPKLITSITLVRPSVEMAEKKVHDELAKMLKEQQQSSIEFGGGAIVLEGGGIRGAASRAVLRTIMTLTANRQNKIVGSVDEAIPITLPFVRSSDGMPVTRAAFEQALKKVRAAYDAEVLRNGSSL
jgi:hypothetical protein